MYVAPCALHEGGCCFCHEPVADIKFTSDSPQGGMLVRICHSCLRELLTKVRNL